MVSSNHRQISTDNLESFFREIPRKDLVLHFRSNDRHLSIEISKKAFKQMIKDQKITSFEAGIYTTLVFIDDLKK